MAFWKYLFSWKKKQSLLLNSLRLVRAENPSFPALLLSLSWCYLRKSFPSSPLWAGCGFKHKLLWMCPPPPQSLARVKGGAYWHWSVYSWARSLALCFAQDTCHMSGQSHSLHAPLWQVSPSLWRILSFKAELGALQVLSGFWSTALLREYISVFFHHVNIGCVKSVMRIGLKIEIWCADVLIKPRTTEEFSLLIRSRVF